MATLSIQNRRVIWSRVLFIALFFFLLTQSDNTPACPIELPTSTLTIKGYRLAVELATTPAARKCGLSNRSKLSPNHGMLFIYPSPRPRTFWMKNTFIPLSIAFLDDSGKIINIQKMDPFRIDKRHHSVQPVRYALEVNQGWFKKNNVKVGDTVEMQLPIVIDVR